MVKQLELLPPGDTSGQGDRPLAGVAETLEERRLAREFLHNLAEWLRSGRIREEAVRAREALLKIRPSGEIRR